MRFIPTLPTTKPVYRSSGRRGFSDSVGGNPRHVLAQKFEHKVQVRFAADPCTVQTLEGHVLAKPGDAIITGIGGESWRVSRAHFVEKYRAIPPTVMGEPGTYVSLRYKILALRLDQSFDVWLSDGISCLNGRAGDWLVDYGDGSLGVVAANAFATTYEIINSPPA
jgi:PGDYG protein